MWSFVPHRLIFAGDAWPSPAELCSAFFICITFLVSPLPVHCNLVTIFSSAVVLPPSAAVHCWHLVPGSILHKPGAFLYFTVFHCHSGQALEGGYFA